MFIIYYVCARQLNVYGIILVFLWHSIFLFVYILLINVTMCRETLHMDTLRLRFSTCFSSYYLKN